VNHHVALDGRGHASLHAACGTVLRCGYWGGLHSFTRLTYVRPQVFRVTAATSVLGGAEAERRQHCGVRPREEIRGEFPEVADDSEPELSVLSATFPELPHQLQGLAYGTPPSATAVASSAVLSWSRAMIVAAVLDLPGRLDCEASGLWQGKDLLRDCPPTGAGSESGTSRPQRPRRAGSPRWSPVLGERLGPGVLVEVRVLPDVLDLTAAAA
jgi:hypothetical protein